MSFVLRRVLASAALLLVASMLTFVLAEAAPGDFLSEMELHPQISRETVQALRERYGLDEPLPARYGRWLGSVLRGELGWSFAHNAPVAPLLLARAGNTLLLTVTATAAVWLLALPLGAWAAWRPHGVVDRLGRLATATLLAVPELLLALACLLLAAKSGFFPLGGTASLDADALGFWARLGDRARHLALPAAALALAALPPLFLHVRAAFAEALAAPFIQGARGHGVGRRRLLWGYALPAAANPLITLFGFALGGLLSGSLVVEVVLGWPGVGPLLLAAILARDLHVVVGAVLLSGALLAAGNLVADLLLYWSDPRVADGVAPEAR